MNSALIIVRLISCGRKIILPYSQTMCWRLCYKTQGPYFIRWRVSLTNHCHSTAHVEDQL